MKKLLWILLVLILLVGIVVWTFPARIATSTLLPESAALKLEEVSGSIWNGSAGRVLYRGQDQGQLSWRIAAGALLRGRIEAWLKLHGAELEGEAQVTREGERVRITDARITLPATRLEPMLDIPALHLTGTMQLDLAELELRNRVPTALKGTAIWREAGVTGEDQARFGNLTAEFGPMPKGGFGGVLGDQGGPLALDGHFQTNILSYEAEAILAARDGDQQVTRALRHIGEVQPDGSVLFQVRGGLGQGKP